MRRVILTFLVLVSLAFIAQAEVPRNEPIQRKEETLKLEEENGKKVLKLAGKHELAIEALLRAWAEVSGNQVIYQPQQIASFKVTVAAPEEGKSYDADGIEGLLADSLWEFRLYLMELSPHRFHIVQITEAMTYAPFVDVAALKDVPEHRVVNLCWRTAFPELFQFRANATNLVRPEAMNMTRVPGSVLLCERAGKLRALIPSFEEVDRQVAKREIRLYHSDTTITAANVAKALDALIPKDVFVPQNAVSAIPNTRMLLVWAVPEIQALIPGVLKQLAEAPKEPSPVRQPVQPKWEVRRYEVPQHAEVADVVAALEKLFDTERTRRLAVVAIPGKKAIAVRTLPEIHDQVGQFIELLK